MTTTHAPRSQPTMIRQFHSGRSPHGARFGWGLLLLLGGCAAEVPMTHTGFLNDYAQLEPAPERTVAFVPDEIQLYRSARLLRGERFRSVIVEPAVYRQAEGAVHHPADEDVAALTQFFTRQFEATLGQDFEIVSAPEPGSLRVRTAITALDPSQVLINVLTLIALVPFDMGGISGEIEVLDAVTGERIAAMTLCRAGTPFLVIECFSRYGHARHGIKKWAEELRQVLTEGSAAPTS